MSKTILAIDPGDVETAFVQWDGCHVIAHGKVPNEQVLFMLTRLDPARYTVVLEMVASYGMAVGKEVFETVFWIGQYYREWQRRGGTVERVFRMPVKMHHCGNSRAKDGNIRQALIDRFGAPGKKAAPGVTYGLADDEWQALALAAYYFDTALSQGAPL